MNDPVQGRTLYEDVQFYLLECVDFDKIAPAGMFDASETRSTKKNGKKAKPEAEQTDIEEATEEAPAEVLGGPHGDGESELGSEAVH